MTKQTYADTIGILVQIYKVQGKRNHQEQDLFPAHATDQTQALMESLGRGIQCSFGRCNWVYRCQPNFNALWKLLILRRYFPLRMNSWWRHQMETFSALLAFCAGNSSVPGEFPAQRPVTRSFEVFFDLHPNKPLSKQSWGLSGRWRIMHCRKYMHGFGGHVHSNTFVTS